MMKNNNDIQEKLVDFIEKKLPKEEMEWLENQLKNSKELTKEYHELKEFLGVIDNDTEEKPSEKLRLNFEQFLSEEKEKLAKETKVITFSEVERSHKKQNWTQYLQVVASVAIVISAFLMGKYQPNNSEQTAHLPTQEEKEMLAMLDNQSASKRIQAIDLSEDFVQPDTTIINALIDRLFNDENTNVRLASAEALSKFSSLETVRNALIKALKTDEKPTLQIELIQILAKIQEKKALEPMKKLLDQEETPNFVKQELQNSIASLL